MLDRVNNNPTHGLVAFVLTGPCEYQQFIPAVCTGLPGRAGVDAESRRARATTRQRGIKEPTI